MFEFVSSVIMHVCFTPWLSPFFLFTHAHLSHFSWSPPASLFIRSWMWCLSRRLGIDWGRHTTASKQSISSSVWHSGLLVKPSCYFSSALARSCYSGVSLQRRKALWQPPLRAPMSGVHLQKIGRGFIEITHLQLFLRGEGGIHPKQCAHSLTTSAMCLCNELAVTLNMEGFTLYPWRHLIIYFRS